MASPSEEGDPPVTIEGEGEEISTAIEPAAAGSMRELMPAIEPDRRLDDWGRSERADDIFDSTVAEFYYRYWFRAEVEGIENIPSDGGVMLAANHAGALPPDAMMIAKAIKEEHANPRPLYTTFERSFKTFPGLSMLAPKIGWVASHPANLHRLLHDEQRIVLIFPEGREGASKLYSNRYQLRRFGRGEFVESAMRARATIVPVCVVGAEEAMPVFARSSVLGRITGRPYFPFTPTFPWLGPFGAAAYLPAKFKLRFLKPIETSAMGREPEADPALIQSVSKEVRARIQENLHEMLASRQSVWTG